ncbi:MAG: HEAT repeat domain-containing protein [Thermodesulfovibrionales bacterium]|nr:HEAT repeat domain-containing protein [Thermodesulfovibrionales bacterium]
MKIAYAIISTMEQPHTEAPDMQKMIAEHMENGCLDNIIDMFKYDKTLYDYIPGLMTDERLRVRIGTIALLETLKKEDAESIGKAIQPLIPLLKDENPRIRGDVAYVLGLIGDRETIPVLEQLINNEDPNVGIIVREAIEDIQSRQS